MLFFDGIALALPSAKADRLIESSPVLAQPLAELGLLRNYDPNILLKPSPQSSNAVRHLREVDEILARIPENQNPSRKDLRKIRRIIEASSLSQAWTNYVRKIDLAWEKYGDTAANNQALAIAIVSILVRRNVVDVAIQPVIENANAEAFVAMMIGSHDDGRAKIVVGDLAQIGIDLSAIPLDEVLDFRSKYGSEYRRYASDVRKFILELSLMNEADRHYALIDRRADLDDRAQQLRKIGRISFARQAISFGFGAAGAAWTLVHGDAWGAAFAACAASAGLTRQNPEPIGAGYTYILRAKAELAR